MEKIRLSLIPWILLIVFSFDPAEKRPHTAISGSAKVETYRLSKDLTIDTDIVFDANMADTIKVDGEIIVDGSATLVIAADVVLELVGDGTLFLRDGAEIAGEGEVYLTGNQIILGDPDNPSLSDPVTATIENLIIDAGGGVVDVIDEGPDNDGIKSQIFITNRLSVLSGVFDTDDNNLWIVGPTSENGGVSIEANALISGGGTFFLAVDPAALGGSPNTRTDAFRITGDGVLNMGVDKITDAGIVMELSNVGAGGMFFNRAGALYITTATTINGTFRAEFASRTEFDALNLITGNLEIEGPGGEVFPSNGTCGDGNESGVYFFNPVTVRGDVILVDTDDPALNCGIQGLSFEVGNLNEPGKSTFNGTFTAKGTTGVTLSSIKNVAHNLALEGNVIFGETPAFTLDSVGTDCDCQNRVIFSGSNDQLLQYKTVLSIEAVEIAKTKSGSKVEIDPGSEIFEISSWLNLQRGHFITHGLLDANGFKNGSANVAEGNCVTINSDGEGIGILDKGTGQGAYHNDLQDYTPRKIKYVGSQKIASGDEIPNFTSGSFDLVLDELEVSLSSEELAVFPEKNLNISGTLKLSLGGLELNGMEIDLGKTGVLAESPGNTVRGEQGTIKAEGDLIAPDNENIGGLGAVISSTKELGPTVIIRRHAAQTIDGRSSIKRYYDINPTNNSELDASLTFQYDDDELGDLDENRLQLYRSTDTGITWSEMGGSADTKENKVILTGIPEFSRWTLAEIPNLPPDMPVIISPTDEGTVILEGDTEDPLVFDWEKANDPDGDLVTYTWQLDIDKDFASPLITQETDTVSAYVTDLGSMDALLNDQGVEPSGSATFVHRVIASDGLLETNSETAQVTLTRGSLVTAIDPGSAFPGHLILEQNYPNPFAGSTEIKYALPHSGNVQIVIFDLYGRLVATVVDEYQPAGWHVARWDARSENNGVYFYSLSTGKSFARGSMIFMK